MQREVSVGSLRPGTAFRVDLGRHGNLDYRLIRANDCRAWVEPLVGGQRQIKNSEGEVMAEFEDRSGRCNIAPATRCTVLEGVPVMTNFEEKQRSRRGERHYDAQPAGKPVRPNTKRAKMLEMLLDDPTGQTDINSIMLAFDMDRNLVVAHVHEMHVQHGYGYSVVGDTITIMEPLPAADLEDLL